MSACQVSGLLPCHRLLMVRGSGAEAAAACSVYAGVGKVRVACVWRCALRPLLIQILPVAAVSTRSPRKRGVTAQVVAAEFRSVYGVRAQRVASLREVVKERDA